VTSQELELEHVRSEIARLTKLSHRMKSAKTVRNINRELGQLYMREKALTDHKQNPLSDWTGQIALAGALVFAGLFYWRVNAKD